MAAFAQCGRAAALKVYKCLTSVVGETFEVGTPCMGPARPQIRLHTPQDVLQYAARCMRAVGGTVQAVLPVQPKLSCPSAELLGVRPCRPTKTPLEASVHSELCSS